MTNPLLNFSGLPGFSSILPEHVEPAIDQLLAENRTKLAALLESGGPYSWQNLIKPLEEANDRLSRAWSPASHLKGVMDSEALRAAYNACLPKLSEYGTEMGQNEALYQAYQSIADSDEFNNLDDAQRKAINDALRDFKLSGVALSGERKDGFKELQQQLSALSAKFSENVLDATQAWSKHITDESALAGLPESAMAMTRQTAEAAGQKGWILNLEFPCYFAVMAYADDQDMRREVYEAFSTRASDQGPNAGEFDNTPMIEDILKLRHQVAQLLDFDNYADYSLATKMADSADGVITFLDDLAARCKPQAEKEFAELCEYAKEHHCANEVNAWDVAYFTEKLREHRYDLSQESLRPYFPETKVVLGLFQVAERLYGVKFQPESDVEVWHPDVRCYRVEDANGKLRGRFFIDLYARANKRGGAWMDGCIDRRKTENTLQEPAAYLVCNFTGPIGKDPALFTHSEVETLFHEFGHGMHHLLTKVDYSSVSGINGVEWDAVELPSQFMENWCWEREAVDLISSHYKTGEAIPDDIYQKMKAAKNFQSAMMAMRQLEFALFDFRIHREYDPAKGSRWQELLNEVRVQVAVVNPPEWNRFPHAFSHIFGGGYAAGYYSYKWAEVLSADAFSKFEKNGIFDRETGTQFMSSILEKGGSRKALENFVEFRGREPNIDALLRHTGIAA